MDSATQVETQSEFRLHQLQLQNFKRFEDITLTLTPSPKIIVGANGSGKTQILWAILIFLRGHNARVPSSKHFDSTEFNFSGELQDLFGDRLFVNQYKAPHTLVHVDARDKKFTLTGTFHDTKYHHKANKNVVLQYSLRDGLLHDKPENHESLAPIRFAFMPPTYQWGDLSEERLRIKMFLTAGVQHLRPRLFQAKDFVNDGLHHLGFQATVAAPNKDGPAIATVTERGATLDIGACAGSLQKIIAILTLLYHLTTDATINAAQVEALEKKIAHDSNTFKQRIFLIDELESLLYENVTAKLYDFLVSTCAEHDIQLIVATNSRAIIDPRLKTDQQIMFLTPDGKAVELTDDLPKDEQGRASLYPILDALSQVKSSKPLLVLEGTNDQAFYSKYTTLGQHFHFLTTSGAVNKQNLSNILTQAKLKHVFLRDSDMYAASPDLPTAQARITQVVGAPVIYTLLPCIESYLILHRLLRSTDVDARRAEVVQALQQRKWYFVSTFRDFCKESKQKPPPTAAHHCEPEGSMQRSADRLATMTNDDLSTFSKGDLKRICDICKQPIVNEKGNRKDRASAAADPAADDPDAFTVTTEASTSTSNPATEAAAAPDSALSSDPGSDEPPQDPASDFDSSENDETMAMVDRVLADSENDPDVLWNSLIAQLTAKATSSFDRNNRVSFWTTYVSIVRGHDLMPNAAAVMRGLERQHLHPAVKALLADTEQAVLACLC
ncbi:hypothetical protein CAOG_06990 [Capsaspora owczarzaki ATCC 30864]|uniref:AAA+ ATPase domain-containing protein n=1 Tax=Capsaspora owczarzaki (strain ATCC 30864) TaxID=595528 RepID=A0A0D2X4V4_CAPO3|nr:hypothetical protein CAOG_06990 [Capsaspora owczarzaki ATCC 30864]KJE96714.1 hypothetical protein CAOG_006990 [Capsaspora owczarzaki ATCC 30864]|eukprot:XP_004343714.2 hypothetical protein CAOG_06990 [Capsaspora owczarzaki ATCC 30864]